MCRHILPLTKRQTDRQIYNKQTVQIYELMNVISLAVVEFGCLESFWFNHFNISAIWLNDMFDVRVPSCIIYFCSFYQNAKKNELWNLFGFFEWGVGGKLWNKEIKPSSRSFKTAGQCQSFSFSCSLPACISRLQQRAGIVNQVPMTSPSAWMKSAHYPSQLKRKIC